MVDQQAECPDCEGTGMIPAGPDEVPCGTCNGTGRLNETHEHHDRDHEGDDG